jgi:hypothetical protein
MEEFEKTRAGKKRNGPTKPPYLCDFCGDVTRKTKAKHLLDECKNVPFPLVDDQDVNQTMALYFTRVVYEKEDAPSPQDVERKQTGPCFLCLPPREHHNLPHHVWKVHGKKILKDDPTKQKELFEMCIEEGKLITSCQERRCVLAEKVSKVESVACLHSCFKLIMLVYCSLR